MVARIEEEAVRRQSFACCTLTCFWQFARALAWAEICSRAGDSLSLARAEEGEEEEVGASLRAPRVRHHPRRKKEGESSFGLARAARMLVRTHTRTSVRTKLEGPTAQRARRCAAGDFKVLWPRLKRESRRLAPPPPAGLPLRCSSVQVRGDLTETVWRALCWSAGEGPPLNSPQEARAFGDQLSRPTWAALHPWWLLLHPRCSTQLVLVSCTCACGAGALGSIRAGRHTKIISVTNENSG